MQLTFSLCVRTHYSRNWALGILRQSFAACGSDGMDICSVPRPVSNLVINPPLPGHGGKRRPRNTWSECIIIVISVCCRLEVTHYSVRMVNMMIVLLLIRVDQDHHDMFRVFSNVVCGDINAEIVSVNKLVFHNINTYTWTCYVYLWYIVNCLDDRIHGWRFVIYQKTGMIDWFAFLQIMMEDEWRRMNTSSHNWKRWCVCGLSVWIMQYQKLARHQTYYVLHRQITS